jgi:hypothetical protein
MYGILTDDEYVTIPCILLQISGDALLECSEALADVDAEIAEIEEICDCVKPRQSDEEISIVDLVSDALDAYFDVGFGAGKAEGYEEGYRASESEWDEMTWLDSTKPFLYGIAAASILYGSLLIYHFFPFTN